MNLELDRLRALDALLEQALSLNESARANFLSELRERDAPTAEALVRLLAAAVREDSLVDGARWGRLATEFAHSHQPGKNIGGYVLETQLGVGGMGEVWLARAQTGAIAGAQVSPNRRHGGHVALKLIRSTLSRAELGERLRRERDILMRLAHPAIARLLDSGVSDEGEPYLVLEYVAGVPLLEFAANQALGLRARVKVFAQICDAVAAAQARLIVHRDIKPQNILVTESGQAKLLDFGIAKLLDDSGVGASTELTAQLGRALTPAYAAPEQLIGEPVTTATDVYSLGVLLHELLIGQRPQRTGPEAEITLPSKLARYGAQAPGIGSSARAYASSLRGDLDCLMRRALAHAPNLRYGSAHALASDVHAYLGASPLQAQADSALYRLSKLIARHPIASLSFLLALAAVLTSSAFAWQQSLLARREAARAAYVQSFLEALFSNDLPGAPRDQLPTTAELLRRGSAQALADKSAEPGARLALLLALARIQSAQRELEGAKQSLQAARALVTQVVDAPSWRGAAIDAELASLSARRFPGKDSAGLTRLRDAIALAQAQNAPQDWLVDALNSLTNAEIDVDQGDASRASAQRALDILNSMKSPPQSLRLSTLNQAVAALTFDQQYRAEAQTHALAALTLSEQAFGLEHAETAYAAMRLALTLRIKGDLDAAQVQVQRAVAIARRAYPDNHPQLARILEEAARIALRLNQNEQGVALWREVLAIRKIASGASASADDDYAVLRTESFLAAALLRSGELEQAATLARHAQLGLAKSVGSAHPLYLDASSYAAEALIQLARAPEAKSILPAFDAAYPNAIDPNTRWRFLELQLIASSLELAPQRAAALQFIIQKINAESHAPKEIALLLLRAAAFAIENNAPTLSTTALNASAHRLKHADPSHLMEIHRLLSLLADAQVAPQSVPKPELIAAREVVFKRRGARHFSVQLADQWLRTHQR
jgi:eukaryotic-like serine/threonine-protein kinase